MSAKLTQARKMTINAMSQGEQLIKQLGHVVNMVQILEDELADKSRRNEWLEAELEKVTNQRNILADELEQLKPSDK